MYQLNIKSQDYSNYSLDNSSDVDMESINFNQPDKITGLFHGQLLEYDKENDKITTIEPVILPKKIIGELELYSKYSFKPNKRGVPAYIFRPINKIYPKCIVHSKVKSKYTMNILITVDYTNWEKKDKFAKGNIVEIIGQINDVKAIQESILCKYNLPIYNLKCDFKQIPLLYNQLLEKCEDREFIKRDIISIDPDGCKDIDDAMCIYPKDGNIILDIHIADVYHILYNFNLLDKVKNVTSIYLDSYIKHMLPTIISSNYGSLIEKTIRFMLSIEIVYNTKHNKIISTRLRKTYGKITKNYSYDNYPKKIFKYSKSIRNIYKLVTKDDIVINDSHKLIEAIMIIYNTEFCNLLKIQGKQPIYRIQEKSNIDTNKVADDRLNKFLSVIKSRCAEYSYENISHATLNISNYTHATSPLRRMADLLNQEMYYTGKRTIGSNFPFNNQDKDTLNYINRYNNNLKKAYRDINKLVLADKVYKTEEYKSECFIYDVKDNLIFLYFPDENLSIKTSILHKKINHVYSVELSDNILIIKDSDNVILSEFNLNRPHNVKINGKPNVHYPDKSIVINFENITLE